MKKVNYVLGSLLIVIGLVGVMFTAKDFASQESVSGEETYEAEQIDSIIINSDVASVRILPTSDEQIKVDWSGKAFKRDQADVQFKEEDGTLEIYVGRSELFRSMPFSFGFNFDQLQLDVYLPERQYASIQVANNVGSINLTSIKAHMVIVESDVASVVLEDVVADAISATSAVGSIKVENSTGKLTAISDVGKIEIVTDEIADDMDLQTDIGSIDLRLPTIPTNITFSGTSELGSVKMFGKKGNHISNNADYIVTMQTEIGSIKVSSTD